MEAAERNIVIPASGLSQERTLDVALSTYDKEPYRTGDEINLADLCYISLGTLGKSLGFSVLFCKYPHVTRGWMNFRESKMLKVITDLVPASSC